MICKAARWVKFIIFLFIVFCTCNNTYARVYYINAETGDDNNSGRSPGYPWKTLRQVNITTFEPGDSILFKSGQEWLGMLYPRGSGTEGNPIVISKYGGTEKPKIHGGHADLVDFEGYRTIQTVLLYNQQYWVISNLEITNMPDNVITDFNENGYERRRGIYVAISDTGEIKGITICDNYIHHVQGDDTKDFHGSGGIIIVSLGKSKPSFYNGIHIHNNHIYMVNRTGICISSYWQRRPRTDFYPESWMDKMGPYHANLNVIIRNNYLESIGGDGIVPQASFKALMEYNRVNGAASRSDGYNAGLWAWNSDSVMIQYNEVWNTKTIRDGMAFDCDAYSVGHTYQYNYSHDNEGGFMLLFGHSKEVPDAENIGHLIRYNISMNDGNSLLQLYGSGHTQSVIHSNLFYNTNHKVHPIKVDGKPQDIKIYNNIFYMSNMDEWLGVSSIDSFDLSNNLIYSMEQKHIPQRQNNIIKIPLFKELFDLFERQCPEEVSQIPLTSDNVQQIWESIFQKRFL